MSLLDKVENYLSKIVDNEKEMTALNTELLHNPRLQTQPERMRLMKEKSDRLHFETVDLYQQVFGKNSIRKR